MKNSIKILVVYLCISASIGCSEQQRAVSASTGSGQGDREEEVFRSILNSIDHRFDKFSLEQTQRFCDFIMKTQAEHVEAMKAYGREQALPEPLKDLVQQERSNRLNYWHKESSERAAIAKQRSQHPEYPPQHPEYPPRPAKQQPKVPGPLYPAW